MAASFIDPGRARRLLLPVSGHPREVDGCLLSTAKRTSVARLPKSANDLERSWAASRQAVVPINVVVEPDTMLHLRPRTCRGLRFASKLSELSQPAVIDRIFCKLNCLLGRERIG